MRRILLLNENRLELDITKQILSSGLSETELLTETHRERGLELLRDGSIDLLIVDILRFDLANCNMLTEIKKAAPETPILVTSSGRRHEVASCVWRLGIQDYLLKPYRPAWLLAAARVMVRSNVEDAGAHREEALRKHYLNLLSEYMRDFKYKKCMNMTREYLDLLHRGTDNTDTIRSGAVAFAEGLAKLADPLGPSVQWKLSGCVERFRTRFDLQSRKYETGLIYEQMLGIVFESIGESRHYEVSGEQRILNYIDLNIKRGIDLDEIAEYANMSASYFSKFFKKSIGTNFITYVTEQKIELAQWMLLNTNMPVINIAYELSYRETNYFSKFFKKKTGVTPTEFRERGKDAQQRDAN